jgi:hypothetical protein
MQHVREQGMALEMQQRSYSRTGMDYRLSSFVRSVGRRSISGMVGYMSIGLRVGKRRVHPLRGPELRALRPLQGNSPYVFVTEAGTHTHAQRGLGQGGGRVGSSGPLGPGKALGGTGSGGGGRHQATDCREHQFGRYPEAQRTCREVVGRVDPTLLTRSGHRSANLL